MHSVYIGRNLVTEFRGRTSLADANALAEGLKSGAIKTEDFGTITVKNGAGDTVREYGRPSGDEGACPAPAAAKRPYISTIRTENGKFRGFVMAGTSFEATMLARSFVKKNGMGETVMAGTSRAAATGLSGGDIAFVIAD